MSIGPESRTFRANAVLFDLDGVLVDSMSTIREIFTDWARSRGLDPEQVLEAVHGRPTAEGITELVPADALDDHLAYLTAEEIRRSSQMHCLPGAKELLARLPHERWAVVTSGTRDVAEARLEYTGLPQPVVLVTADDVAQGKPAPDCYLLAADRLGAAPGNCVVVEDAPSGVRAAAAAGMQCIGIGTRLTRQLSTRTVGSLAEVHLDWDGTTLCLQV